MYDAYATQIHYLEHMAPILQILPHRLFIPARLSPAAERLGLDHRPGRPDGANPVLIASYIDSRAVRQAPRIYLEHGAGQTYLDVPRHPSYSGGTGHEGTELFLCPSEIVARRWREHYPAPAVVVGCPKLDHLRVIPRGKEVAISFHSDLELVPETRSAYRHYARSLKSLAEKIPVIGHGHPRIMRRLRAIYEQAGIEVVERFDEVVRRAGVYCVDNSSSGWEMAELGRAVVWLNAPWFRREVDHGLRFWDASPQVDGPDEFLEAIEAKQGPGSLSVYDYHDARSSERAVEAIFEHVSL